MQKLNFQKSSYWQNSLIYDRIVLHSLSQPHFLCLNIDFQEERYGNYQSQYFQIKNFSSVFQKRFSFSRKLNLTRFKAFKIPNPHDCRTKICRSIKIYQRYIAVLIIHSTSLGGTYPLSGGFKAKTAPKSVSCVTAKTIPHFPVKFVERRNRSFSVYMINHLDFTDAYLYT